MTEQDIHAHIQAVLDDVQPFVARDGGKITFVAYEEGVVKVALDGACVTCPMSLFTLKLGLEERLKERLPFIKEVIAVK